MADCCPDSADWLSWPAPTTCLSLAWLGYCYDRRADRCCPTGALCDHYSHLRRLADWQAADRQRQSERWQAWQRSVGEQMARVLAEAMVPRPVGDEELKRIRRGLALARRIEADSE